MSKTEETKIVRCIDYIKTNAQSEDNDHKQHKQPSNKTSHFQYLKQKRKEQIDTHTYKQRADNVK